MAERIKLLPDSVSNQIAAGEVVNRPASVVKEMMENAVDAGSKNITVNFRNGGKDLIQIIDDGSGMSPADARMAFEKHATSKIKNVDDIYKLHTFGFRGEALASIAAVAEVELITKTDDSELGYKIEINGGKFGGQSPVAAQTGSQFLIRNLFYNIPGRKRFLDKSTTEGRHITAEYNRVALCHPEVGFKLYDSDTLISDLPAGSLRQRIADIAGKSVSPHLLEINADTSVVQIKGYIGRPAAARQTIKEQYLFVNGRFFKSGYLHKAVLCAYEKLIPTGSQPPYFIYLTVDPERIDVNVHPQKTEIKFEDSSVVWQIINAAVRESLAKSGAVPQMDFDMETSIEIPVFREKISYETPKMTSNPDFNPFEKYAGAGIGKSSAMGPNEMFGGNGIISDYAIGSDDIIYEESVLEFIEGDEPVQGTLELDTHDKQGDVMLIGAPYAVTTIGGSLVIIDMSRAQEAILYDRYVMMLTSGNSVCQQLLFPEEMTLSGDDYALICEFKEDFANCGFDITPEDNNTIRITGGPADVNGSGIEEQIYALLEVLHNRPQTSAEARKEMLAATMARAGARNMSTPADNESARILIATLMGCENHSYTPSGLTIMSALSPEDIRKRFK